MSEQSVFSLMIHSNAICQKLVERDLLTKIRPKSG